MKHEAEQFDLNRTQLIVRFRGAPMRFRHVAGRRVAEVCVAEEATRWAVLDEPLLWVECARHGLAMEHCQVEYLRPLGGDE